MLAVLGNALTIDIAIGLPSLFYHLKEPPTPALVVQSRAL